MTKLTEAKKFVQDADSIVRLLIQEIDQEIIHGDKTISDGVNDYKSCDCLVLNTYTDFVTEIKKNYEIFTKFKQKIEIQNDNRQTYSKKTIEELKALIKQFDSIYETYENKIYPYFQNILSVKEGVESDKVELSALEQTNYNLFDEGSKKNLNEANLLESERRFESIRKFKIEEELRNEYEESKKEDLRNTIKKIEGDFITIQDEKAYFRRCLERLIFSGVNSPWDVIKQISIFVDKICSDPSKLEYRILRILNNEFKNNFHKPGCISIFRILGFRVLMAKEFYGVLSQVKSNVGDLSEYYLYLEEPDASQNFDDWINWLNHLEKYRDILKRCSKKLPYIDIDSKDDIAYFLNSI